MGAGAITWHPTVPPYITPTLFMSQNEVAVEKKKWAKTPSTCINYSNALLFIKSNIIPTL